MFAFSGRGGSDGKEKEVSPLCEDRIDPNTDSTFDPKERHEESVGTRGDIRLRMKRNRNPREHSWSPPPRGLPREKPLPSDHRYMSRESARRKLTGRDQEGKGKPRSQTPTMKVKIKLVDDPATLRETKRKKKRLAPTSY